MCSKPVIVRYQGKVLRIYFRADAAFAIPGVYECRKLKPIKYAIRLPANQVLQNRIAYLLKLRSGRPPNEVRRYYWKFSYQAASWSKLRRVIAKVEWRPGQLYSRVGFIVTNMSRPAERVVAFYNKRGTAEQWIKEGKGAIKWTRLSCRTFAANAVRLQLHALAYNLGNFLRTLATPEPIKDWEEYVQMLAKMARSAPRSPFAVPGMTAVVRAAKRSCQNAAKTQKSTTVRGSSGESRWKSSRPSRPVSAHGMPWLQEYLRHSLHPISIRSRTQPP